VENVTATTFGVNSSWTLWSPGLLLPMPRPKGETWKTASGEFQPPWRSWAPSCSPAAQKLKRVVDKYSHEIGEPLMKEMLAEIEKVRAHQW